MPPPSPHNALVSHISSCIKACMKFHTNAKWSYSQFDINASQQIPVQTPWLAIVMTAALKNVT